MANPNNYPPPMNSPAALAQFTAATSVNYHPRPQGAFPLLQQNALPNTLLVTSVPSETKTILDSGKPENEIAKSHVYGPPPEQAIDLNTFKGFKFVTMDGLLIATRDIYDELSGTYQWDMCETQEERCLNSIKDSYANKRVFFICSGSLGKSIVPKIHELPQVYAIYVYCADVKSHKMWAGSYTKVRIVCNNDDQELIPQFGVDVAQANVDWGNAFLKSGDKTKAKQKFELAMKNLHNPKVSCPDPAFIDLVRRKLQECN